MLKKIVTVGKRQLRYDRKNSIVECIQKVTPEMLEDNREWQSKYGRNLWDIDTDGYWVCASAGLRAENWNDAEARAEYLEEWCYELDDEEACLVESVMREFRA